MPTSEHKTLAYRTRHELERERLERATRDVIDRAQSVLKQLDWGCDGLYATEVGRIASSVADMGRSAAKLDVMDELGFLVEDADQ